MLRGLEWRVGREQAGWEKGSSGSGNLNRMLWVLPEETGGVWQGALPDMLPRCLPGTEAAGPKEAPPVLL